MLIQSLLVAHIAVLGYWLGSELVINHTFRYVSWSSSLPFAERDRLLDHVLDVDQHVRYALILQLGLGVALGALLGYFPGGTSLAVAAGFGAGAWLLLAEATHRQCKAPVGALLSQLDIGLRYLAILALGLCSGAALSGYIALPGWLAIKLGLFASVILCGLGIRLSIIRYYRVWRDIEQAGATEINETRIRQRYWQATAVLVGLWVCIVGIVTFSLLKVPM